MSAEDEQQGVGVGNPVLREGFTIVPNIILRRRDISRDAKMLYAVLLSYAWQKDHCHPGYETLMADLQCGRAQVSKYLKELQAVGLVEVKRRGLGQTSMYFLPDRFHPQEFRNETSVGSAMPAAVVPKRNAKNTQGKDSVKEDHSSSRRTPTEQRKRDELEPWVSDFHREFRDSAPLDALLSTVTALYAASGLSHEEFTAAMMQAREKAKRRAGVDKRVAYWLTCLKGLVGVKEA